MCMCMFMCMYTCDIYYESIWPKICGHIDRVMCCEISAICTDDNSCSSVVRIASVVPYETRKTSNKYILSTRGLPKTAQASKLFI